MTEATDTTSPIHFPDLRTSFPDGLLTGIRIVVFPGSRTTMPSPTTRSDSRSRLRLG